MVTFLRQGRIAALFNRPGPTLKPNRQRAGSPELEKTITPYSMPLPPIVFEDESIVAFDKPSGLLVAPDRWDKTRVNLMGLIHSHPRFGPAVANVHRLDADTR